MYSYGPPHMAKQKQDDQLEYTYSSYVRIWDVALKTCQKRWRIGRSAERVSGISVPVARHDDLTHRGTTTLGQNGPESNGNERVLHISHSSSWILTIRCSLVSYPGHSFGGERVTPLQSCNQHIRQSQLTGLNCWTKENKFFWKKRTRYSKNYIDWDCLYN